MVWMVDPGSSVASGDSINMNATEVTLTHANFNPVPNVPGKSTGSSYNFRLAQGRYLGFENPRYVINGVFEDPETSYNNPLTGKNYVITGSMLKGIALAGSVFALIDPKTIVASPFGGGSLAYVMPVGYNITRNAQSSLSSTGEGYVLNYSIDLVEVQV